MQYNIVYSKAQLANMESLKWYEIWKITSWGFLISYETFMLFWNFKDVRLPQSMQRSMAAEAEAARDAKAKVKSNISLYLFGIIFYGD